MKFRKNNHHALPHLDLVLVLVFLSLRSWFTARIGILLVTSALSTDAVTSSRISFSQKGAEVIINW